MTTHRGVRGGSCGRFAEYLRSAKRFEYAPDVRGTNSGFRVATRPAGAFRVIHGGSWFSSPRYQRSAVRFCFGPRDRLDDLGFRVVVRS